MLPLIAAARTVKIAKSTQKALRNTDTLTKEMNSARGIKNATVRYEEQKDAALTASRIRNKKNQPQSTRLQYSNASDEQAAQYFFEDNPEFSIEITGAQPTEKPPFPYMILTIALLKDLIDIADITIFGIILTTVLSFILALILFLWFLGKMSGVWYKKHMVRWFWKRFIMCIFIESIPFLKIIPTFTILILMAHKNENKIVIELNKIMESLHTRGFKFTD